MPHQTRNVLIIWGNKSTDAEYLAAGILSIEKFEDIDPIHPQGGPDGIKDILCKKENILHVAACYFPNNSNKIDFKALKSKFTNDLAGVKTNGAKGFIFFTNVEISERNRKKLKAIAKAKKCLICLVYHLERIRAILDSPHGYGLRQSYLGIKMNSSEKTSAKAADSEKLIQAMNKSVKKIEQEKNNFDSLIKKALSQAGKFKGIKKAKKGVKKKL
jgi:hypothetical protein